MRKSIIFSACAASICLLAACDNIDENDRLIPIEREHSDKVVLIEEFTGARCVNCPTAATQIHDMLESDTYKDNIVAVSLYPSQMEGNTYPINVDLRTQEATDLFAAYNGISIGLPCAMFDRASYDGNTLQTGVTRWPTIVSSMMKELAPLNIALEKTYDASSRNLTVDYTIDFIDPTLEEVYVQLYLVENNITSMQLSLTGLIRDYTNNHVLRAAINGTWGTSLSTGHVPGSQITGSESITLKADWNADNVQVVGFVYRASDRHVLQATLLNSITD